MTISQQGARTAAMAVLDIAGTVVPDDGSDLVVPEPVRTAVHHVRDKQIRVVLTSDQPLTTVLSVAEQFGLDETMIVASDGAVIARHPGLGAGRSFDIEDTHTFDAGGILATVSAAFPEARIAVEDPGVGFTVNAHFEQGVLAGEQTIASTSSLGASAVTLVVVQVAGIAALAPRLESPTVKVRVADHDTLELTAREPSSAAAVRWLCLALNIPTEAIITVAATHQGIELFSGPGHHVAMGQAPAEVRTAAHEQTGTFADHGLVPVLDSLTLSQRTLTPVPSFMHRS